MNLFSRGLERIVRPAWQCIQRKHTFAIITGNLFGTQTNKTNRIDFRLARVTRHDRRTCMNCVRWRRGDADDDDISGWRMPTCRKVYKHVWNKAERERDAPQIKRKMIENDLSTNTQSHTTRLATRSSNTRDATPERWAESKSREWFLPHHPHDMYLFRESVHELYIFDGIVLPRTAHKNIFSSGVSHGIWFRSTSQKVTQLNWIPKRRLIGFGRRAFQEAYCVPAVYETNFIDW